MLQSNRKGGKSWKKNNILSVLGWKRKKDPDGRSFSKKRTDISYQKFVKSTGFILLGKR